MTTMTCRACGSSELATMVDAKTIAFPCISTGAYGYPFNQAARIAVAQVRAYVAENAEIEEVVFCCFSDTDLAVYEALLQSPAPSPAEPPSGG